MQRCLNASIDLEHYTYVPVAVKAPLYRYIKDQRFSGRVFERACTEMQEQLLRGAIPA